MPGSEAFHISSFPAFRDAHTRHFDVQQRQDAVYPQALSSLAACVASRLYIVSMEPNDSRSHVYGNAWAQDTISRGFVLGWVSLLSTRGKERIMLLDMKAAISWLNSDVRIEVAVREDEECFFDASVRAEHMTMSNASSGSSKWSRWILTIHVPQNVYHKLPSPFARRTWNQSVLTAFCLLKA